MSTILVIEDDADLVHLVTMKLSLAGHRVVHAGDGEVGLQLARDERPDLVVVDWMLPRLTGIEICAALRRDDDLGDVPILMLTAKAQEADIERGFAAGADDYVTKPFSPRELTSRVHALLQRATR